MSTALAKRSAGRLSKYNPQMGLKQVAIAEMREKHFARAKDARKLIEAIEEKLTAQAEFVFWWDTQAAKQKGRPEKRRGSATVISGREGLPARYVIDRWRRKLNDPDDFERTKAQAIAKYPKLLEFETIDRQLKSSESNEWYTPIRYLDAARMVLGQIDLDPASNTTANRDVQASSFFSIDEDGLSKDWPGRVWLNPPYGGLSGPFTAKLVEQFLAGTTTAAVLLVNSNSTDAAWFQPLWDFLLCFTNHRINFLSPTGQDSGSTHGSVFVYLGSDRSAFIREFSPFGAIVERVRAEPT